MKCQVQQIRDEIKRRMKEYYEKEHTTVGIEYGTYDSILSFIDSLKDESDLDDINNRGGGVNISVSEIFEYLDYIANKADFMTSGNFMHHKNTISFAVKLLKKRMLEN